TRRRRQKSRRDASPRPTYSPTPFALPSFSFLSPSLAHSTNLTLLTSTLKRLRIVKRTSGRPTLFVDRPRSKIRRSFLPSFEFDSRSTAAPGQRKAAPR
ncbi:MAG: hypothetical protein IJE97_00740, partial [Thermoguttaceae bacterium]|nr:hypothetical protein [Thermoguttaceae bacterium]